MAKSWKKQASARLNIFLAFERSLYITASRFVSAVALIMLLTAASAGIYIYTGKVTFGDALPYLPAGLIGSVLGSFILPKIPTKILGKIFALFMLWAGVRMLMR